LLPSASDFAHGLRLQLVDVDMTAGYAVATMCIRYSGWYFFGTGVSPGVSAGRV